MKGRVERVPEFKSRRWREVGVETKMLEGFGHKGRYIISKYTSSVKVSLAIIF
jgi:hypothetical protein